MLIAQITKLAIQILQNKEFQQECVKGVVKGVVEEVIKHGTKR